MTDHPHASIISLWGSIAGFARDLSDAGEVQVSPDNARKMIKHGIPEKHWHAAAAAATKCGFEGVTYAALAELAKGATA